MNYKKPSLFIGTCFCTWKCCDELRMDRGVCQNAPLASSPVFHVSDEILYQKYSENPITKAIVLGGLEPFEQWPEISQLIRLARGKGCKDDIVIYTGFYLSELSDYLPELKAFQNIILKTGRYNPSLPATFNKLLGVTLASSNQAAIKICEGVNETTCCK